jgi:Protein of unknown function (DUF2924)
MKKPSKMKTPPSNLDEQLEQLKQLKPEELRKRWQAAFSSNPPAKIRSSLMIQAIGRRLQEKAFGGLKPSTRRLLQKVAEHVGTGRKATTEKKAQPRVGTVWYGNGTATIIR